MAYGFKSGLNLSANLEVDDSNPITRDIRFLGVPRQDGIPIDLVRRLQLSRSETNKTTKGLAINGAIASNAASAHLDFTSAPFSIWAYCYIGSSSGGFYSVFTRTRYGSESDNEGYGLETDSSNNFRFIIMRDNGAASYALNGSTFTSGFYNIAGTTDGTTKRIYNEGAQTNSSTGGNLTPVSNTGGNLRFGEWATSANNGTIIGAIWRRVLSADEIRALYQDPFQLVRLKRNYSRLWIAGVNNDRTGTSAVTAPAATLTASGTVVNAYTGTSAVTAAAATLSATGTVVNPAAGFGSNLQLLGIG